MARQEGLAVMAWSPLAGGWLTGKYRREMATAPASSRAAGSGGESWALMNTERTWQVLDQLGQVATDWARLSTSCAASASPPERPLAYEGVSQ